LCRGYRELDAVLDQGLIRPEDNFSGHKKWHPYIYKDNILDESVLYEDPLTQTRTSRSGSGSRRRSASMSVSALGSTIGSLGPSFHVHHQSSSPPYLTQAISRKPSFGSVGESKSVDDIEVHGRQQQHQHENRSVSSRAPISTHKDRTTSQKNLEATKLLDQIIASHDQQNQPQERTQWQRTADSDPQFQVNAQPSSRQAGDNGIIQSAFSVQGLSRDRQEYYPPRVPAAAANGFHQFTHTHQQPSQAQQLNDRSSSPGSSLHSDAQMTSSTNISRIWSLGNEYNKGINESMISYDHSQRLQPRQQLDSRIQSHPHLQNDAVVAALESGDDDDEVSYYNAGDGDPEHPSHSYRSESPKPSARTGEDQGQNRYGRDNHNDAVGLRKSAEQLVADEEEQLATYMAWLESQQQQQRPQQQRQQSSIVGSEARYSPYSQSYVATEPVIERNRLSYSDLDVPPKHPSSVGQLPPQPPAPSITAGRPPIYHRDAFSAMRTGQNAEINPFR
jgi:hypothetical protein